MESKTYLISDEELIKLAGEESLDEAYSVNQFIKNFKLAKGKTPLAKKVLYTLYKNSTLIPVKQSEFYTRVSLTLPSDRSCFFVSTEFFETATGIYNELYLKKEKKRNFDKRKMPKFQFQFEKFRKYYNLQKGKDWLEDFIIYHFYDKWVYNEKPNYKRQFKKTELNLQLKDHFEFKQDRNGIVWFGIDASSLIDISPEQISNIRTGKAWRDSVKKENKKKQR